MVEYWAKDSRRQGIMIVSINKWNNKTNIEESESNHPVVCCIFENSIKSNEILTRLIKNKRHDNQHEE